MAIRLSTLAIVPVNNVCREASGCRNAIPVHVLPTESGARCQALQGTASEGFGTGRRFDDVAGFISPPDGTLSECFRRKYQRVLWLSHEFSARAYCHSS